MSLPTAASTTITIDAPPEHVYDLIADITRMSEWSPECIGCEWLGEPNQVGSTFRGRNRRGIARWSTLARVLVADRPGRFTFATLHRGEIATRWSYELAGDDTTTVTETFTSVTTPLLIGFVERWIIRDRQAQLESGMAQTLAKVKTAAETRHAL
jgi:Polyketide cyclase / dehydrase and lipid transport.